MRYYFDHNATTPVRPEVVEAMLPWLTQGYGNPSSIHAWGREAKVALERSRGTVAAFLGADPDEIYFTGSGTESDNMALTGTVTAAMGKRSGIVTTAVEHAAVLNTARALEARGHALGIAGVEPDGRLDMDSLRGLVGDQTALVSVMHANNETGVIHAIAEAARIAHDAGALFHTDAVQSAGKLEIDVRALGIDLLSLSGHKLNAQKGVGVLYARRGVRLSPVMFGGGHERGLRPATENIPAIVGLACAVGLAAAERDEDTPRLAALRDRLEQGLADRIDDIIINGLGAPRLPGTTNISLPGVDGEALAMSLDIEGVAASTGSACTTGEAEPSHVLTAMGRAPRVAQSSLRFSLGWGSEIAGVDHVVAVLPAIVKRLRSLSAVV